MGDILSSINDDIRQGSLDRQIGGQHYKNLPIQPIEFILANNLSFIEGNIIKYLVRWKCKNGVEDLKKAAHYLELLIEHTEKKHE